ncbi:hypothetical protein [Leminorella grimontii]|uniref:hypothetical protein n=1 Tax=Leminorella grimontii TaxID=82981 RepID=UPI001069745D|nr:hypothetical protein [Leminorella grimontii]VFS61523.1 Uncharacterised protein [Leminorella grimontii]
MRNDAKYGLRLISIALLASAVGPCANFASAAEAQGRGDVIVNVERNGAGGYRATVVREGGSSPLGPSYYTAAVSAGETLSGQVSAAGQGVCLGRFISGNGELSGVRIPIAMFSQRPYRYEKNYLCGNPISFAAPSGDSAIGFVLGGSAEGDAPEITLDDRADLSRYQGQRVLLGRVRLSDAGGEVQANNVYLSFPRSLRGDTAILTASFIKADAATFNEVATGMDSRKTATLVVGRTLTAPPVVIPFKLSFESAKGAPNADFRMYGHENVDRYIPYSVSVNGQTIGYRDELRYSLGSSPGATQMIDITFTLRGKDLAGLKGGTHFSDTFTAVVTPEL